jgi:putative ABC transport system permease protein
VIRPVNRLIAGLKALLRGRAAEQELDDELQAYLDASVESKIQEGVDPTEAKRSAHIEIGSVEAVKDYVRDVGWETTAEGIWIDLRQAARTLRKSPVFTATAVLTLAVAIGANTAIFSLIDSLLLRALPLKDPFRLVVLTDTAAVSRSWSYPIWDVLRRDGPFAKAAAWSLPRFNLASGGETRFVDGLSASGSFFETLGVTAFRGRMFSDADDRPSGGPAGRVAVISYAFWQDHFDGAEDVIGQVLPLDGVAFTIVGVTPPEFFGMVVGRKFDVAVPLETRVVPHDGRMSWLSIVGRLKPEQTRQAAAAAVQALAAPMARALAGRGAASPSFSSWYVRNPFALSPAAWGISALRHQYEEPLLAIQIVVVLVMLVACANVANLLLARAAGRRDEFSILLALGATRWQVARRVLAESVILAGAAAGGGLAFAAWGGRALVRALSAQQSTTVLLNLSMDWRVLAFTMAAGAASVLLFGVVPAIRAGGAAPLDAQRPTRSRIGGAPVRGSGAIVTVQLAISVVLVVAAGLFVRTFADLVNRPLGFDANRLLLVSLNAQRVPIPPEQRVDLFEQALEHVRSVPGVADAAAALLTPISGTALQNQITVSGTAPRPEGQRGALVNQVSPEWLRTVGTPLVAGRNFGPEDRRGGAPVAIVNETFSRTFLGGANPIGRTIAGLSDSPVPIVGVMRDAVYRSLREPVRPTIYLPFAQSQEAAGFGSTLIVRSAGGTLAALAPSIGAALRTTSPDLEWTFRRMDDQIDASVTQERLTAWLAGFFGIVALLLAAIGLYGVIDNHLRLRRSEIGIRMALGASSSAVVRLVVSRVVLFVTLGAAAGMTASVWLSRLVSSLLYGVQPGDPATLGGATILLAFVGVVAVTLPARRATRIDPAIVLRDG